MLESTKIKIFGVVGTICIVATAFTLHANTFYKELYEDKFTKDSKIAEIEDNLTDIVISKDINITPKKSDKIASKPKPKNRELEVATDKIQIEHKIEQTHDLNKSANRKLDSFTQLQRVISEQKYIYIDENSKKLSIKSQELLKEIKPIISNIDDIYIEIEGYSASKDSTLKSLKDSQEYAQIVYRFLKEIDIDKEIIITAYGDRYPIIDDKTDSRNSRVELKIRRR